MPDENNNGVDDHDEKLAALVATAVASHLNKDKADVGKSTIKTTVVVGFALTVLVGYLGWCGVAIISNSTGVTSCREAITGAQTEKVANLEKKLDKLAENTEDTFKEGTKEFKELHKAIVDLRLAFERDKLERMEATITLTKMLINNENEKAAAKAKPVISWPKAETPKEKAKREAREYENMRLKMEAERKLREAEARRLEQRKLIDKYKLKK